jgi:DNA-binding beta-propeller fold protein YncE
MFKSQRLLISFPVLILIALLSAGCKTSPTPMSLPTKEPAPAATPTTNKQENETESNPGFVWKLTGETTGFKLVLDSAVDLEGNLLVIVESDDYRVMKFDSNGNFLVGWGGQGSGEGEFSYTSGVSYDSIDVDAQGHVFITDYGNDRIQIFDSEGNFLRMWGHSGDEKGQFFHPIGIAVDKARYVYVTDSKPFVQKFDRDGNFLLSFGEEGSDDGQFRHPTGMEVDDQGFIYVADYENHNIQKFDSQGQFITAWKTGSDIGSAGTPESIAMDSLGRLHVTDLSLYRVEVFSPAGESLWSWGGIGTGDGQFLYPTGLSIDPDGNIYLNDPELGAIQKYKLREE